MGSAEVKSEEKHQEITECPICKSTFNDPRILPCVHTFCLKCLTCTGEANRKKPGDKLPCPLCRREFIIPENGMIGLQRNFFIENFMNLKSTLQIGTDYVSCDMCVIRNEGKAQNISTATVACIECKDKYCDSCSKVHQKQKLSVSHHIVKLGIESEVETRRLLSTVTCAKHTHKPLDYYCTDCKMIVCVSCFVESHKLHDCKDVATVEEEFRQIIENHLWKISTFAEEMLTMRRNAEMRKEDFLKEITEKENAIQKRNQELTNMITEHTKWLLEELSLVKSNNLKKIENEIEEVDSCWTKLRSFETYCRELSSKGSASDICSSVALLTARAYELEKDYDAFIGLPRHSVEVSFQTTDIQEVFKKSNRNVVGQFKETTAQVENFAVIAGLDYYKAMKNDVVQINLHRPNEISTQQQLPTTMRYEATAAVYRNTMYVVGIGENANEIWNYSASSGWMKCASLVQGRRRHSAAFIDEVLYICGGCVVSGGRVLDNVEAYNAVNNKCSTVGKLVHCVMFSGNCVPFKTSIYIFGGWDKSKKMMNCVQVYNTKLNTCIVLSKPMPQPSHLMRAALWENSVILVGRYSCFIFNFETQTWLERQQFKTDVVHFGLVLENERLFVIGGGNSENGKDGKEKWKCRDDVHCIRLRNIIENKPIEWKVHAKLPQPSLIVSCEKLTCSQVQRH